MPRADKFLPIPFLNFKDYKDATVMVVTAHPDDADWFCGGTAARFAAAGANVIYVIATDGGGGSMDTSLTRSKLTEIREKEQREANAILGVADTIFLRHPDGALRNVQDLDKQIAGLIREHKPKVFMTFDPAWSENVMHPDHRAAALAALRAVRFAVLPLCFTDEEPAGTWLCHEVLLFRPTKSQIYVNVFDYGFKKLQALNAHESQMEHMLDDRARKLLGWVLKRGDKPETRLLLCAFAQLFYLETFRRFDRMEMLR